IKPYPARLINQPSSSRSNISSTNTTQSNIRIWTGQPTSRTKMQRPVPELDRPPAGYDRVHVTVSRRRWLTKVRMKGALVRRKFTCPSNRTAPATSDLFSMASSPALPLYASRYPTPNGYPQINGEVDAPLDFRKVESLR
uniref:Uncharacterized protein n=1 Tax=Anopheles minimus TaxID=112268 RepID=A0A182W3Y5_9DIPT